MLIAAAVDAAVAAGARPPLPLGADPHPVRLVRPPAAPLSAMAQVGRAIFFDRALSSSGRLSCASCHSPQHAYGPPGDAPVMNGGAMLLRPGVRAVPSLTYLERQPNFSVGPDDAEREGASASAATPSATAGRARKTQADAAQSVANLVPQGGLFWDGRADTLQSQAEGPLLNPLEMDGHSVAAVATKLRRASYAASLQALFGAQVLSRAPLLVAEATFAVARYQIEDPAFHPYTSKYDYWLEGKAQLTPAELRGYRLFNDPKRANCAGCHLDRPAADGLPPSFTDHQFEALGVPRNAKLAVNRDPAYFDLGICGPLRADMRTQTQDCGMFLTPTLRNVATRHAFFHNGVYHSLRQVLDFYDFRDTQPQRVYPRGPNGAPAKFDDLPPAYRANVDTLDPPFDRRPGASAVMSPSEERDVIAFLRTLTDGFRPSSR